MTLSQVLIDANTFINVHLGRFASLTYAVDYTYHLLIGVRQVLEEYSHSSRLPPSLSSPFSLFILFDATLFLYTDLLPSVSRFPKVVQTRSGQ
ncbi:hypothetical protein AN958_01858 [Leucoagaricus sp. SymC.cos]|nr:hypothetical protein AN958_01858 [Leucoagaricus sp. SymC.cos]